ncbi:hypothetical protein ACQ4PT_048130 [Festuca glaucescens]
MNTQRLELIRKRREEDDEEFMFLLLPILHYHKRSRRGQVERTQRHSSVLYGMQRVQGILDGHVKNCRVAYRMEPHIFRSLASYLRRENLLKDKRIKVEEKLAFFLYMLSHNASFEALQLEFEHSNRTFHKCIREFFNFIPVLNMKPTLHPVGTPKFNLKKAALGVRKTPPTNKKKKSPKATKARAQWNLGLEKSLVDILHEHNNDYYRAQNGWSGDTWNRMTQIFQERNQHVNFVKSQLQDKEKELKREYKMLKEARMQSGAGWDEKSCRIVAEKALWDNLEISFPRIGKFKRNNFPMYDSLGDLYDGQIAEGNHNFTSTSKASQLDEELEDERVQRVQEAGSEFDEDIQILDEDPTEKKDEGTGSSVNRVNVGERMDKKATGVPKKIPPKELKKPIKSDEMVQVVDMYVKMKEKQADDEKAESSIFSIAKCIAAVNKIQDFTRQERVKASKVFKSLENRETFLTWVAEDEESAIMWLRGELQELT